MAAPEVIKTAVSQVNLTVIISVISVCLAAMGTIVAVFRRKPKEDKPDENILEKVENKADQNDKTIGKNKEDNDKKIEELRRQINENSREVIALMTQSKNDIKNIDENRQNIKDLARKLDNLLKQILDGMAD